MSPGVSKLDMSMENMSYGMANSELDSEVIGVRAASELFAPAPRSAHTGVYFRSTQQNHGFWCSEKIIQVMGNKYA